MEDQCPTAGLCGKPEREQHYIQLGKSCDIKLLINAHPQGTNTSPLKTPFCAFPIFKGTEDCPIYFQFTDILT